MINYRNSALLGATALCALIASQAHGQDKPVLLIGLTSDASGQYANSGAEERRGVEMAIAEFNAKGGVLGRKIETIHIDTETSPATGSRVAERMITRDKAAFLIGGVSSGVANAVSQVAQKYGVIYLNTNSSAPSEAGENCHRVKFVWDGNGVNFSQASVKTAIETYGPKWMQITNDYVWGHDTSAATRKQIEAFGGTVIEDVLVPQGTRDFSAVLIKVQQNNPSVIAAAVGGDDLKAMRAQVSDLKLGSKYVWINNQQDWADVYGLPKDTLFGVFGTTWYYNLDLPGVADFVKRYQEMYPDTAMKVPGNVFFNGYWGARSLLEAVEKAGTTNNHAVIKQLEQLRIPAEVRMQHHDAYMNPDNHQMQQTIYLATANLDNEDPDDLFKIISNAGPETVMDKGALEKCKLESFEDTPVYEP
ncbi:MAG: ABC transporter substrate-binding protein [Pseudaminobacter sp.]|nr:ABC transporter substrate-binding protein [Pseudaminobacter sp.]